MHKAIREVRMRFFTCVLISVLSLPIAASAKPPLPNVSGIYQEISRSMGRLMIGNAALLKDNNDPAATWLPDGQEGAYWLLENSTFASMPGARNRLIAVTGTSKTSLGDSVAIGVSGAIINDSPGKSGWALYSDVQHEKGLQSFGLEIAAKNVSEHNPVASPYALSTGVMGIWLAGGGDHRYGGAPTHPNNAAMVVLKNASTWNRGIVFGNDALTGTTGDDTGTAVAISMAMGQLIRWEDAKANAASLGIEKGEGKAINIVATPAGKKGKLKTPRLNISDIPTSPEGLVSGDIWRKGDTLKIVP